MKAAPHQLEPMPPGLIGVKLPACRGGVIAGEGVAVTLAQVGVVVAQVEREGLLGEAEAARPRWCSSCRECRSETATRTVRRRRCSRSCRSFPATSGRHHPTRTCPNAVREQRARQHVFGGAGRVGAVGAGVEDGRRVVHAGTDREGVGDGVARLAVHFPEAQVLLDHVAVARQAERDRVRIQQAVATLGGVVALTARIPVVPGAEVERELAEGRPDAAVEVDFGGGTVRERDALAGDAHIALQLVGEVVARLEIGRDRRLVIRLGDAAEVVVRHQGRAEGDVPRTHRSRNRRRLGHQLAEVGGMRRGGSERGRHQLPQQMSFSSS